MKKFSNQSFLISFLLLIGTCIFAQDYSSLEGSHYYLIVLDADSKDILVYDNGGTIVQDLRPQWSYDAGCSLCSPSLYIREDTYVANPPEGRGFFGQIGAYFDFSVQANWSELYFTMIEDHPNSFDIDYTSIQSNIDKYRFHMAIKSPYNAAHTVNLMGGTGTAAFSVGVGEGLDLPPHSITSGPNITPRFEVDKWYIIDKSMAEMAALGWEARASFRGDYLTISSGSAPNRIMFDAIFYYKTGHIDCLEFYDCRGYIEGTTVNKLRVFQMENFISVLDAPAGTVELYSLVGVKVKSGQAGFDITSLAKGAYILKCGNETAKIIIK